MGDKTRCRSLAEQLRTHVAHDADHFRRKTGVVVRPEKYLAADRIFVREKFLRGRFAHQDHERRSSCVALSEIATGQERNAEGAKITGRNAAGQPKRPLIHRQRIAVDARVGRSRKVA